MIHICYELFIWFVHNCFIQIAKPTMRSSIFHRNRNRNVYLLLLIVIICSPQFKMSSFDLCCWRYSIAFLAIELLLFGAQGRPGQKVRLMRAHQARKMWLFCRFTWIICAIRRRIIPENSTHGKPNRQHSRNYCNRNGCHEFGIFAFESWFVTYSTSLFNNVGKCILCCWDSVIMDLQNMFGTSSKSHAIVAMPSHQTFESSNKCCWNLKWRPLNWLCNACFKNSYATECRGASIACPCCHTQCAHNECIAFHHSVPLNVATWKISRRSERRRILVDALIPSSTLLMSNCGRTDDDVCKHMFLWILHTQCPYGAQTNAQTHLSDIPWKKAIYNALDETSFLYSNIVWFHWLRVWLAFSRIVKSNLISSLFSDCRCSP